MKTIGIIGGMGPLATCDLYKKITLNTKADCDQQQIPIVIDSNTAIPDRTACITAGGENPLPEMKKSVRRLVQAGADFLIMPCNTAHYFYSDLQDAAPVPILHMLELTAEHVARKLSGSKSEKEAGHIVGLLATDGTLSSGVYDKCFDKYGIRLVKPQLYQNKVMEFIYEGIKKNNLNIGTSGLDLAVEEMKESGASLVILGCTELSAAVDYYHFDDTYIDPLAILAKSSICYAGCEIR